MDFERSLSDRGVYSSDEIDTKEKKRKRQNVDGVLASSWKQRYEEIPLRIQRGEAVETASE